MAITSFRLDNELLRHLDSIARKEHLERTAIIKKALEIGLRELKIEEALKEYQEKKITAWKAARKAEISLWGFFDLLKERNIYFETSEEDLREMLNEL